MNSFLPILLAVIAFALVGAMPWRRTDPHHDLIFGLVRRLAGDDVRRSDYDCRFSAEDPGERRTAVTHHYHRHRSHV